MMLSTMNASDVQSPGPKHDEAQLLGTTDPDPIDTCKQ